MRYPTCALLNTGDVMRRSGHTFNQSEDDLDSSSHQIPSAFLNLDPNVANIYLAQLVSNNDTNSNMDARNNMMALQGYQNILSNFSNNNSSGMNRHMQNVSSNSSMDLTGALQRQLLQYQLLQQHAQMAPVSGLQNQQQMMASPSLFAMSQQQQNSFDGSSSSSTSNQASMEAAQNVPQTSFEHPSSQLLRLLANNQMVHTEHHPAGTNQIKQQNSFPFLSEAYRIMQMRNLVPQSNLAEQSQSNEVMDLPFHHQATLSPASVEGGFPRKRKTLQQAVPVIRRAQTDSNVPILNNPFGMKKQRLGESSALSIGASASARSTTSGSSNSKHHGFTKHRQEAVSLPERYKKWQIEDTLPLIESMVELGRKWEAVKEVLNSTLHTKFSYGRVKHRCRHLLQEKRGDVHKKHGQEVVPFTPAHLETALLLHKVFGDKFHLIRTYSEGDRLPDTAQARELKGQPLASLMGFPIAKIETEILRNCSCSVCTSFGPDLKKDLPEKEFLEAWTKLKSMQLHKLLKLHIAHGMDFQKIRSGMNWTPDWTDDDIEFRVRHICNACLSCSKKRKQRRNSGISESNSELSDLPDQHIDHD